MLPEKYLSPFYSWDFIEKLPFHRHQLFSKLAYQTVVPIHIYTFHKFDSTLLSSVFIDIKWFDFNALQSSAMFDIL